jgi:hypothetical protein
LLAPFYKFASWLTWETTLLKPRSFWVNQQCVKVQSISCVVKRGFLIQGKEFVLEKGFLIQNKDLVAKRRFLIL